ncbi:MAG TPA: hypothetical protein VGC76_14525 [Pyrinomonadaceae bacterium]|jgi:hypothetical protein
MSFFSAEVQFNPFAVVDVDVMLAGVAYEGAEIIHEKIVGLMNEPKHGNPYKHRDNTVRPASEEGEAPGINSKDLVGSFDVIALSMDEAQINSDIDYGNILQEKRDRPFTEPAVELAIPEIAEKVEGRMEEEWR